MSPCPASAVAPAAPPHFATTPTCASAANASPPHTSPSAGPASPSTADCGAAAPRPPSPRCRSRPLWPAAAVDCALPADVVPAPTDLPGRWQLQVDTGHPVFFDHPLDHVSGMLLLKPPASGPPVR
ncbi:AfsA-related hotdog domain-containing protein [Streptomyces sp. TLI_185]|uniref:AfsA-related hotdog domain-containing protein n=1 Tax=Streptomyces sp. TLI_185 TaxID=2485151 RepID=UPI0021A5351F|nr:AfsA-related hotdog domain-containing protein [Streptomyces sp. TLI_185]